MCDDFMSYILLYLALLLHELIYIMGKGFVLDQIRKIASLPAKMDGLSIPDCTSTAEMEYSNSVCHTPPTMKTGVMMLMMKMMKLMMRLRM